MVDALWGVLLDGCSLEFRKRCLEGLLVEWLGELDIGAVLLARVVFFDAFDHVVGRQSEAVDFDRPSGGLVDLLLERFGVRIASLWAFDLEDERAAGLEHAGVDVLAARAVEFAFVAVHRLDDVRADDLLDAGVV